jgi:single-stranded-DNA-specific exonuclease
MAEETEQLIVNPTPDFETARQAFAAFVESPPKEARTVCLHDSDADGITAGVVWLRVMERLGFTNLLRFAPDRERNAWSASNRARVADAQPERLFVLDLGSQAERVLPDVPTCFVDHHRPEGVPAGDTLISAYSWKPIPNTSLMMWNLGATLTDVSDLDWIAAIGTVSDLGERAPFDLLEAVKKKYTAKYLKEATAVINASRRSSRYAPELAAHALLSHDSPRALVDSQDENAIALREMREEVKQALDEAKKAAPTFAGNVALVRMHSACQVHPLIAQIWRSRLPKYMVIAANTGYLPGRVNFSARSAPGVNILEFLRGIELPEGEGHWGHGHDQASGGSLPVERWNALLEQLGFPPDVCAQPPNA